MANWHTPSAWWRYAAGVSSKVVESIRRETGFKCLDRESQDWPEAQKVEEQSRSFWSSCQAFFRAEYCSGGTARKLLPVSMTAGELL